MLTWPLCSQIDDLVQYKSQLLNWSRISDILFQYHHISLSLHWSSGKLDPLQCMYIVTFTARLQAQIERISRCDAYIFGCYIYLCQYFCCSDCSICCKYCNFSKQRHHWHEDDQTLVYLQPPKAQQKAGKMFQLAAREVALLIYQLMK